MSPTPQLFIHIVTFNSAATVAAAIEAALAPQQLACSVLVTDNCSQDNTAAVLSRFGDRITVHHNPANYGFCAAHNQGVAKFLASSATHLLILNPDLACAPTMCAELLRGLATQPEAGIATPKLLRCDTSLTPLPGPVIDAAGMTLTPELRHFDRGSGLTDGPQYSRAGFVFGGTGAALLLTRAAVERLLIPADLPAQELLVSAYPQIPPANGSRAMLFDEAFFAYREDAELAWRAQRLGVRCLYWPAAVGYHQRVVVPEKRAVLPKELNLLGVQNRFLLQLNHYSVTGYRRALLPGFLVRNLAVIGGVLLKERSSLPGLLRAWRLLPRALALRSFFRQQSQLSDTAVARWLTSEIEYV